MNKVVVLGHDATSKKFVELKREANMIGAELDLVSYNRVHFDTRTASVFLGNKSVLYYDVYFFRNAINSWEEIDLVASQLFGQNKIVIDPVMRNARPSDICKAIQMIFLSKAGLPVPKTIYGSLDYLYSEAVREFQFPLIIKGSKGDRRSQVFKVGNRDSFNSKISELRHAEANGENKYMLQEYIVNTEDFRIMVVGGKVLGVMKRALGDNPRRRDVFENSNLPDSVKDIAVKAAKTCGMSIAGVDIVLKNGTTPLIYEVNKTPCYDRFVEVTGINVAREVVQFLVNARR